MSRRATGDSEIQSLLHRLDSSDAGAAWAAFVDRYSPLIMHAVRQFEFEQDRVDDCYLFVCEQLFDNGFRRLLKFDANGQARFSTWLGSVAYNLCVDWHRKEYGRAQMLPAIAALPALERSVYRLYFEQAMDREACLHTLRDEFPGLSREEFSAAIAQVFRLLTPRQRWRLNLRQHREKLLRGAADSADALVADTPPPESDVETNQRREQLERAMASLEPEVRLILNLRYVEGMTLQKIADLLQLGDAFRARRMIEKALDSVFRALPARSAEEM